MEVVALVGFGGVLVYYLHIIWVLGVGFGLDVFFLCNYWCYGL